MTEPVGSLCVLRDEDLVSWTVAICQGPAGRKLLGTFATRSEAADFAVAERDRRRMATGAELAIHFADDCPCYRAMGQP